MRQDISFQPVITEKALKMAEAKEYTFLVSPGATKHRIKETIERTFGVSVMSVRTRVLKGRKKRARGRSAYILSPDQKIAAVRVSEKDKIELFETEEKAKGKKPVSLRGRSGRKS